MGLRFRKSVTLCKGVRLNFGKTGASVSVGGHGYRKTFHSSGKVTTSVGIPETGIYWTDTKGAKKKSSARSNGGSIRNTSTSGVNGEIRDYSLDRMISAENVNYDPVWLTETSNDDMMRTVYAEPEDSLTVPIDDFGRFASISEDIGDDSPTEDADGKEYLTESYIRNIYVQCDKSIDWGEILAGTSADELMMEKSFWMECKKYSAKIMRGDIDTYLEVIEVFRPVDDILLYAGEFEFGTDVSNYIETEFRVKPDEVLEDGINNPLFEEFIYAVSIRVARDLMALLPIKKVVLHVVYDRTTFFSAIMDWGEFARCDFKRDPLKKIAVHMDSISGIESHRIHEVARKTLS